MKKTVIIYFLFNNLVIQSMMLDSPENVIRKYIQQPSHTLQLLKNFSPETLRNYRDNDYNNLMHITIAELIRKKNRLDWPQLLNECKPLLEYLAESGISVNEENDNHETPCFLAYKDNDNDDLVENFLIAELGAHPTYISLQPEFRALKKALADFCFSCCRKSKEE